jgi:hypothetical protein|tara:strand:+ start:11013 stop:11783 length:771 start_codon:yes stop_codon:yes gene_type:complete
MRRRIRLTGRKQLPVSCVKVEVFEPAEGKRVVALSILDDKPLRGFPRKAKIRLRLYENKAAEILDFGTLEAPKTTAELKSAGFVAPSCQLRVVSADEDTVGLLLGSTSSWTLKTDSPANEDKGRDGILMFKPHDIAPRTWKLDIRDQEHPVVYVDKSIPDSRNWVRNDPVFLSAVFPAIVQQVFDEILSQKSAAEISWMNDWLSWADTLMPGYKPPLGSSDRIERQTWIEQLVDTFSKRHNLLDRLVAELNKEVIA